MSLIISSRVGSRAPRNSCISAQRSFEVTSTPEALRELRQAIEDAGFQVESAELTMLPKTTVELTEESAARTLVKLVEALEELDDVQEVYANFDIPEQLLEAVAS